MKFVIPLWAWAGLGLLAYMMTRPRRDTPSILTGEGANLANLAKFQAYQDPTQISIELGKLSAQASALTAKVKETPALGTLLGLSPTQIDYIVLPPEQFRTTYGFTADPEPLSPAA